MPRIDVYSELSGKQLNAVGLAIFKVWSEFAMGQRRLGGRRLQQPTGVYASSLRFEVLGKNHVAVISDEGIAPHARILETGHGAYNMLDYLQPGRAYPITRTTFKAVPGAATRYAIYPGTGKRARTGAGVMRAGHFVPSVTGLVRTPVDPQSVSGRMNTSQTGPAWTVPAMPAYTPTRYIMQLFARRVSTLPGHIAYTP